MSKKAVRPLISPRLLQSPPHEIRFVARSGPEIESGNLLQRITLRIACEIRLSLGIGLVDVSAPGSMLQSRFAMFRNVSVRNWHI